MKQGMYLSRLGKIILLLVPGYAAADTAEVLPKGVYNFNYTYYHYGTISERYDQDGDREDLAADYNDVLNSNVFPALSALDPLVGGNANIGESIVDFEFKYRWSEFKLNYGINSNFSVGVNIPYNYSENKVKATVDNTNANVGKNPVYETPGDPFQSPIIPIALGGVPLVTEDVQQLLGRGLDVNGNGTVDVPGFGYDRFGSWDDDGIGDIELLGKYKFYDTDAWRMAFGGGVRLPTGEIDDPDNLTDLPFGDGTTDLLFRYFVDYKAIDSVLLNVTLRYDWQLEEDEDLRIPPAVDQPLSANKENVDRDLGNIFEFETAANYSFNKAWSMGLKYRYTHKDKDDVDGDMGFNYKSLEDETDIRSHMGFIRVGYSTVQNYLAGNASIPYSVDLAYRNRFKGKNNPTVSDYTSLEFNLYFQ